MNGLKFSGRIISSRHTHTIWRITVGETNDFIFRIGFEHIMNQLYISLCKSYDSVINILNW